MQMFYRYAHARIVFFLLMGVLVSRSSWVDAQEVKVRDVEQLDFANGLFGRQMYAMAAEEYKKYLTLFPNGSYVPQARFGIGESLFFQEKYDEAIGAYEELLATSPGFEKASIGYLRLGQAQFFQNRNNKAFDALSKVDQSKLSPALIPTLNFYLGSVEYKRANPDRALVYLAHASSGKVDNTFVARAYLLQGDIYSEKNKNNLASQNYQKAYERAQEKEIQSLALYKKGEAEFAATRYKDAAAIFKDVIAEFPAETIVYDAYVNLLTAEYNAGNFQEVIKLFSEYKKATDAQTRQFEAYYVTAMARINAAEYDLALEVLDEALKVEKLSDEDKTKAFIKKAESFVRLQDYNAALDIINKKLQKAPVLQDHVVFLAAESYYGLGEFERAREFYKKVTQKNPKSELADEARWANALTFQAQGNEEKALPLMLEYYKTGKSPSNRAAALYNGIIIATKETSKKAAIAYAEDYVREFKDQEHYEKVLFLLGTLYKKNIKYKKAIEIFNAYAQEFPRSPRLAEVYFLLGLSYQSLSKHAKALKAYQKVPPDMSQTFYYSALKNSAAIYLNDNNVEAALEVFRRIILEFDAHDLTTDTILWMAEKYLALEKYNDVLATLNSLKKESEEMDADTRAAIAYYKAEALRATEVYAQAVEQYSASLVARPEGPYAPAAVLGKAKSLIAVDDLDGAFNAYQKVIEDFSNDHTAVLRARIGLGDIERIRGNLDAAVKYYLLVSVLYSDKEYTPYALLKAGELLEKQGKKGEALKAYKEISAKYPDSVQSPEAKEKAGKLSAK